MIILNRWQSQYIESLRISRIKTRELAERFKTKDNYIFCQQKDAPKLKFMTVFLSQISVFHNTQNLIICDITHICFDG